MWWSTHHAVVHAVPGLVGGLHVAVVVAGAGAVAHVHEHSVQLVHHGLPLHIHTHTRAITHLLTFYSTFVINVLTKPQFLLALGHKDLVLAQP